MATTEGFQVAYIFSTRKMRCNQEEEEENAGTTYVGKGNQVMTATNIFCLYYPLNIAPISIFIAPVLLPPLPLPFLGATKG